MRLGDDESDCACCAATKLVCFLLPIGSENFFYSLLTLPKCCCCSKQDGAARAAAVRVQLARALEGKNPLPQATASAPRGLYQDR